MADYIKQKNKREKAEAFLDFTFENYLIWTVAESHKISRANREEIVLTGSFSLP